MKGTEESAVEYELTIVAILSVSMIMTAMFPEIGIIMCYSAAGIFFLYYLFQGITSITFNSSGKHTKTLSGINFFVCASAIALECLNLLFFGNGLLLMLLVLITLSICLAMNYYIKTSHPPFPENFLLMQSRLVFLGFITLMLTFLFNK
jgi:hypothetical protein